MLMEYYTIYYLKIVILICDYFAPSINKSKYYFNYLEEKVNKFNKKENNPEEVEKKSKDGSGKAARVIYHNIRCLELLSI